MEWSEVKAVELISAYEQYESLWKPKHPQHYNKIKKQDAWESIAQNINVDSEECKRKMGSLLSSLRREKAKIKKSHGTGTGRDQAYESNWFAFKRMQFLYDRDEPRTRLNTEQPNLDILSEETDLEAETLLSEATDEATESAEVSLSREMLPPRTESAEVSLSRPREMLPPRTAPVTKGKKRQNEQDARLDKAFNILASSQKKENNEFDIFGELVAKKLQRYTPDVCTTVQEKIMQTLFHADRTIHSPNQTSSSSQYPHSQQNYNAHHSAHYNFQQKHYSNLDLPAQNSPSSIVQISQTSPTLTNFYTAFSPESSNASNSGDSSTNIE